MTVTITRPGRRRPAFHALPVTAVDRLTEDAVAVTFAVPPALRAVFAFQAGQYVTVRRVDPRTGVEARRSYSICSTPAELTASGRLRIGIRRIPGGAFSTFATTALRAGDTVEVLPPLGDFTTAFDAARTRRYGAVVAGSGITPVLALVATGLATEESSTFTVVYGNRTAHSVMFAEELAELEERHPTRFRLLHVCSREPGESPLLSGRIDADRLRRLLDEVVPGERIDEWFLCGPYGMVMDARRVLAERGAPESAVRYEIFHTDPTPGPPGAVR